MKIYENALAIFCSLAILCSCNKNNITENPLSPVTGNGKLQSFKEFNFSYDDLNRLIKVEPDLLNNSAKNDVIKLFYKNNTNDLLRVEISRLDNPDSKVPVILQYDNNNNITKIIHKLAIFPPSPYYNDINYLSTYNAASEPAPVYYDSIVYNTKNNPTEIISFLHINIPIKQKIFYYPGDTLVKKIELYNSSSPNTISESIECVGYDFVATNPLYDANTKLYLFNKAVYHMLPGTILPTIDHAYAPAYSQLCDKTFGLFKNLPNQVYAYGIGNNGYTTYNIYFKYIKNQHDKLSYIMKTNSNYTDTTNARSIFTYN